MDVAAIPSAACCPISRGPCRTLTLCAVCRVLCAVRCVLCERATAQTKRPALLSRLLSVYIAALTATTQATRSG